MIKFQTMTWGQKWYFPFLGMAPKCIILWGISSAYMPQQSAQDQGKALEALRIWFQEA